MDNSSPKRDSITDQLWRPRRGANLLWNSFIFPGHYVACHGNFVSHFSLEMLRQRASSSCPTSRSIPFSEAMKWPEEGRWGSPFWPNAKFMVQNWGWASFVRPHCAQRSCVESLHGIQGGILDRLRPTVHLLRHSRSPILIVHFEYICVGVLRICGNFEPERLFVPYLYLVQLATMAMCNYT